MPCRGHGKVNAMIVRLRDRIGDENTALATGIPLHAITCWRVVDVELEPAGVQRVTEVWQLVGDLTDTLTDRGIRQWLHGHHRLLGGMDGPTPLEAIAAGDLDRVRDVATSFIEGAYI